MMDSPSVGASLTYVSSPHSLTSGAGTPRSTTQQRTGAGNTASDGTLQGQLGAVNASRIAALQGPQITVVTPKDVRSESPAQVGYRRTTAAMLPYAPASTFQRAS